MTAPEQPRQVSASRCSGALAVGIIALAALIAYYNSFAGPLVFDDLPSIRDNPTIRHLGTALRPPAGMTVDARPVLNASLALNYAWSGLNVTSYHVVNLAIHFLAGLTLFGIVRRTLERRERPGGGLPPAAFALSVAVIWLVHPLQTESVTYIVQRAESLMGLFYLLTLYCFIRYADEAGGKLKAVSDKQRPQADEDGFNDKGISRLSLTAYRLPPFLWGWLSIGACLLGMATKEVMASAPVIVLLYDRTFVTGSFRAALHRGARLYAALGSTWILLGLLAISSPGRGGSSGLGTGIGWWNYLTAQFPSLIHYLRLAVWPSPLIFDYGPESATPTIPLLASAALVLGIAAATLAAVWRKSAWGFLGFWFFAILAPSSLFGGNLQVAAEHRMYLPLAAVVVTGVAGLDCVARRLAGRRVALILTTAIAAALTFTTIARNEDYRSEFALWSDTVTKRPENPFARVNLGNALFLSGRITDAVAQYEEAIRLKPDCAAAHQNLGAGLLKFGRPEEARAEYAAAVTFAPDNPSTQGTLATLLARKGDWTGAAEHFAAALRLKPDNADAHLRLAEALLRSGKPAGAAVEYEAGLKLRPNDVNAHNDCGVALLRLGDRAAARKQFQAALLLKPDDADALRNLHDAGSPAR